MCGNLSAAADRQHILTLVVVALLSELAGLCCRLQLLESYQSEPHYPEPARLVSPLISTVWFRMTEWLSNALLSSFIKKKQSVPAHTHAHDSGPSLNSCHDNVQYPFIPKHIADFLKIMCVVFSHRLLSRRQPSEQILAHYKVRL